MSVTLFAEDSSTTLWIAVGGFAVAVFGALGGLIGKVISDRSKVKVDEFREVTSALQVTNKEQSEENKSLRVEIVELRQKFDKDNDDRNKEHMRCEQERSALKVQNDWLVEQTHSLTTRVSYLEEILDDNGIVVRKGPASGSGTHRPLDPKDDKGTK